MLRKLGSIIRKETWKNVIWNISKKKLPSAWSILYYSKTLNNEYIERIHQMSYSSLSDNGMFCFLI